MVYSTCKIKAFPPFNPSSQPPWYYDKYDKLAPAAAVVS